MNRLLCKPTVNSIGRSHLVLERDFAFSFIPSNMFFCFFHIGLNWQTERENSWVNTKCQCCVFTMMHGSLNVFSADSHCDEGYLLFGDYCYHFETEMVKNWQDAENYCVAQNGHLVSIHDQETVSFLTGAIEDRFFIKDIYSWIILLATKIKIM